MKQLYKRLLHLIIGLFLFAVGIVVTLNAHIGYAPWDIFHAGIAKMTGISIGTASIIVGIVIGIIVWILGEKIGLGTILNMIVIGVFIDVVLNLNILPVASNWATGIVMLIIGLYIIAAGSYFYIDAAFGAGPRDSLMVAMARITKLPIGICRAIIEFLVALIGWLLGGMVGIGTIISVVLIGFCIQTTFKLFKFDPAKVEHETLQHTCAYLFGNPDCKRKEPPAEQNASDTL